MRRLLPWLDFGFRLAFFLAAPFFAVAFLAVFPVWGAIINLAMIVVVFFSAAALRGSGSRLVARLLRRQLALEAYYREHPPRPFIYYVLYPVLAPYWLVSRTARREFLLFKGYGVATLVVLVISPVYQYFKYWAPEISPVKLVGVVLATMMIELAMVLTFLMPIATTLVSYGMARRRWRIAVLLVAALLSGGYSAWSLRRGRPPVSFSTSVRIHERSRAVPEKAHEVRLRALHAALRSFMHQEDREHNYAAARAELVALYKRDEASAFRLVFDADDKLALLYYKRLGKKPAVWTAVDAHDREIDELGKLPPLVQALLAR